jgi:hypothetical protein
MGLERCEAAHAACTGPSSALTSGSRGLGTSCPSACEHTTPDPPPDDHASQPRTTRAAGAMVARGTAALPAGSRRSSFGDLAMKTMIRINIDLVRSQVDRQSIFAFDPNSAGAKDYQSLVDELVGNVVSFPQERKRRMASGV